MKENKAVIKDLQTGGFSAHTSIESLADDLYQDMCSSLEEGEEALDFQTWSTPQRHLDIICMYEYEVLEASPENKKAYEEYHGRAFD
ncbi:hypothetical protein RZN22_06195 [Bacillaceae bacterium S4-13-58]